MFLHQHRLSHLLAPEQYVSEAQYQRERSGLFEPAWHVVGAAQELARDGDFLTADLLGRPVLVRNFGGHLRAFLNVCAHRHCMITSARRGRSPVLKCQYHGWEYDSQGRTRRIPDATSFNPLAGGVEPLHAFRVVVGGPLVFVCLKQDAPDLATSLDRLQGVIDEFPAERWRLIHAWDYEFDANWKIPVENTIESYHVAEVHADIFGNYPREDEITHESHPTWTSFRAPLQGAPRAYHLLGNWVNRQLEPGSTHEYRLYHGFPHLFLIRIDVMLQVMCVLPLSPTTCTLAVWVFVLEGRSGRWWRRGLTSIWGRLKSHAIRKVLSQDAPLYPALQRGLSASPFRGMISSREELIFAFQEYVQRKTGSAT